MFWVEDFGLDGVCLVVVVWLVYVDDVVCDVCVGGGLCCCRWE